jgi:flavin-dependent dehydrogenase
MTDVAVIGGGLAGLTAAIALARRGWDVTLYESGDYPRHRVCGEFLSPECVAALDVLAVRRVFDALRPVPITRTLVTTPDGARWSRDLPATAYGLSRYALDALLAEAATDAGVQLRTDTTVTDVAGSLDDGFTLTTRGDTSSTHMVIGAYGKRSRLDHALDRPFIGQNAGFVGLKMHYEGPSTADRVELHAFDGGYCGLSHVEGGAVNLCLLARSERLTDAGGIPAFVEWMGAQNPTLGAWLSDASPRLDHWQAIAQVSFARKSPVERDVLMTGDAAGLISPLAGDGMGMAFDGGLLAASHTDTYLRGDADAYTLRRDYATAWNGQFQERLRVGRLLQGVMLRPSALSLGLRAVTVVPSLGDLFIVKTRNLQGTQSP